MVPRQRGPLSYNKDVDRLHQQNILATNSANEAKTYRIIEREKSRSAPPKHRKHSDDNSDPLKICLPLPKKTLEQEITLDDFPPPSSSKQKPKPKPKKKPAQEQVKEVKTNSKGQKSAPMPQNRTWIPLTRSESGTNGAEMYSRTLSHSLLVIRTARKTQSGSPTLNTSLYLYPSPSRSFDPPIRALL
ncbi:hypothetical protein DFH06DRAFT_1324722 [Mycena polygramma]|nr:hypothetical protein DFH06DRAFT_1324722 [Mycena polygramma]